jgi:hypothetical protein
VLSSMSSGIADSSIEHGAWRLDLHLGSPGMDDVPVSDA